MKAGQDKIYLGNGGFFFVNDNGYQFSRVGGDGCTRQTSQAFVTAEAAIKAYAANELNYK